MFLHASYSPNFYSLEDILVTQERVPTKFLTGVANVGKLTTSVDGQDIKVGTYLEVPLWLALECSTGRQPILQPELPKIFRECFREILKADATFVDLHKFNLHFYDLGVYVKEFDKNGKVHEILLHTFTTRLRLIIDMADNPELNPKLLQKLDILERKLLGDGHYARNKLNMWMIISKTSIEAANMVMNYKRRKGLGPRQT